MEYDVTVTIFRCDYRITVKKISFLRQDEEFLLSNGSETHTRQNIHNEWLDMEHLTHYSLSFFYVQIFSSMQKVKCCDSKKKR